LIILFNLILEERINFGLNPENENDQIIFLRLQYENQKKKEHELEKSKSEAKNALLDLEKVEKD